MSTRVAGVVVFLLAAAVAAASASAASPVSPGGPDMPPPTATLSSTKAGAAPVALTVKLHYEMVCGRPGRGSAVVTLPQAAFVPAAIARSAVLVNGKPAPSVSVAGHDVTIAMPLPHGVTCMSIGPGTLTLTFTRAAGLGNPRRSGTYAIRVRRNTASFEATVRISA